MNPFIHRQNASVIQRSLQTPFVTVVLGPRRVGKTTLLTHLTENIPETNKLSFNMDASHDRDLLEKTELKPALEQRLLKKIIPGDLIWVIVDEVQKLPSLFDQIKMLYDQFKDQNAIKFVLNGSSSMSLHQLTAESLAGRAQLLKLREFNLQEVCALQIQKPLPSVSILEKLIFQEGSMDFEKEISELSPFRQVLQNALQIHLIYGGLPEVLQLSTDEERLRYLSDYLQTYLEKDVLHVQSIGDLKLYRNLMSVLAEQTGSLRNDQRIQHALHCSRETIKKYRDLLAVTFMYEEVYPFIGSSLKRLTKAPKGYLTNNGLISYMTNLYALSVLEKTGLVGHRFENWFLGELEVVLDRFPYHAEINYWRTTSGTEVDFVVDLKNKIIPFEVTYNSHAMSKKIKSLKTFLADEKRASFGVLIYNGEWKYDQKDRIYYLPFWAVG